MAKLQVEKLLRCRATIIPIHIRMLFVVKIKPKSKRPELSSSDPNATGRRSYSFGIRILLKNLVIITQKQRLFRLVELWAFDLVKIYLLRAIYRFLGRESARTKGKLPNENETRLFRIGSGRSFANLSCTVLIHRFKHRNWKRCWNSSTSIGVCL